METLRPGFIPDKGKIDYKEYLQPSEVSIRVLNPEFPSDIAIAHALDIMSADAQRPSGKPVDMEVFAPVIEEEEESADPDTWESKADVPMDSMTYEELVDWMTTTPENMLWVMEESILGSVDKRSIGFAYFYKDELRLRQEVRKSMGLPQNRSVWSFNFYMAPDIEAGRDKPVLSGLAQAFKAFEESRKQETVTVIFLDGTDMNNEYAKATRNDNPLENQPATERKIVEESFQDPRVVLELGATYIGLFQNDPDNETQPPDFGYAITVHGK